MDARISGNKDKSFKENLNIEYELKVCHSKSVKRTYSYYEPF